MVHSRRAASELAKEAGLDAEYTSACKFTESFGLYGHPVHRQLSENLSADSICQIYAYYCGSMKAS